MTERDIGQTFSWWFGEVAGVEDPDQSGRVQVRVYGRHDDKTNIKDEDLPWALPMQPVTSAALGKVGTTPLGLLVGSKVMGFWLDRDQQYPVIYGSFGKAGDLKNDNTTVGGTEQIDIKTGSIPTAAINQSDPSENNPYSVRTPDRISIDEVNRMKKKIDKTSTDKGVKVREDVNKDLKKPEEPTTASAEKDDDSDILDIIRGVDPQNISASLPNAVKAFGNIRNIVGMISQAGQTNLLSKTMSSGISEAARFVDFNLLLSVLIDLLRSGILTGVAYEALKKTITDLLKSASTNGGKPNINYNSNIIPQIDPNKPTPKPIVETAPEGYIQQYYRKVENEPFPGYIVWVRDEPLDVVYTLRGTEPFYISAQDSIIGENSKGLQSELIALFNAAGTNPVSLEAIAEIINKFLNKTQSDGAQKTLGNGISLGNILSLAQQLIPQISSPINMITSQHFPDSFLNIGSMTRTLSEFTQNQALLAKQKKEMEKALEGDDDAEQDDALKDYIKQSVQSDAAGLPSGSVVTKTTTLSDGSTYEYSVTVQ